MGGIAWDLHSEVLLSAAGPAQGLEIVEIDVSEYAEDRIGITWRSRPGQMYGLNVSSDLTNWLEVSDNLIGEAGQETTTFVDVDSGGAGTPAISEQPQRYYPGFRDLELGAARCKTERNLLFAERSLKPGIGDWGRAMGETGS